LARFEILRTSEERPSLRDRLTNAWRSIFLGPYNTKDRELARLFGGRPTASGISINESSAMSIAAVYACVRLISGHLGALPLQLFKRVGRGKELDTQHPLYRVLHDVANPTTSSQLLRETASAQALIWGNAYLEIVRDKAGRVAELYNILPYVVQPFLEHGVLFYRVHGPDGTPIVLPASDVVHVRGLTDDGVVGVSPIGKARESLSLAASLERFGATFFGNGSTFGGIIKYPIGVGGNPQTRKDNADALRRQHGGFENAHRLLALYEGAEYQQVGVPPEDGQFLQSRQFSVEEVCRWFGVAPHKIAHLLRSTYSNIEQQSIEYVSDTLMPWFGRWESELTLKCLSPTEQRTHVIEYNATALLRGDAAGRSAYYEKMVKAGIMTPNECRALENLNPIAGGDELKTTGGVQ
jgi:HK97 family phage portal protein